MTAPIVNIALAGAGLVGRQHILALAAVPEARLCAVVDPAPGAATLANEHGVPLHATIDDLLAGPRPDAVLLATPNHLHVPQALACIAAELPVLVEKPIAQDAESAHTLVEASEKSGVPVLIGHHRRHNPLIAAAHASIHSGAIGDVVSVSGTCWLYKPDDYFEMDWRRKPGAGPIHINLSHDIDLMRHLCGEITAVMAMESHATRKFDNEDTAAMVLTFANGAIGTLSVSDTTVGPWSWELTSGENPAYHKTDASCLLIGGTRGALEIPSGRIWSNPGKPGWWEPLNHETPTITPARPLERQISHFCAVVRGEAHPLVSAREGLRTLQVIEAVKTSAETGRRVDISGN